MFCKSYWFYAAKIVHITHILLAQVLAIGGGGSFVILCGLRVISDIWKDPHHQQHLLPYILNVLWLWFFKNNLHHQIFSVFFNILKMFC